ncbi:MAG: extracellular solute-binding protein [Actinomycetota bacterium]
MTESNLRWKRLLALLFALTLIAAACGSDDDEGDDASSSASETSSESESSSASETADDEESMEDEGGEEAMADVISDDCPIPNPSEEVEIDLIGWSFPIVDEYAKELEECGEGNYSFNIQFLDSQEARDQATLDLSTGEPSFEIVQGSNSFIIELANQGYLRPLNDLIDKYSAEYELDQIDAAFYDLGAIDGEIYAVPVVSNTMHVFYNAAVLEELGLDVPATFADAAAMCPTLEENGYGGFALMASAGWAWQIEFDNVLGSLGVAPIDPVTGQPNFNSPEGVEAANTLLDLYNTCGGSTAGTYSTDDIQNAFQTEEYVVGQTWASRAAAMDDPEASLVVDGIEFAPALSTGGSVLAAPAYMDGYGIPAGIDDAAAEQIFLAIVAAADAESQEAAAAHGTVTRAGISNADGPRNGEAVSASLVNGRGPDLSHPAAGIARAKLGDALIQLLDGASVEDVLAEAETAYLEEAGEQGLL